MPLAVNDASIRTLREALRRARIGETDRLEAFRCLDARVRAAETLEAAGPDLRSIVSEEWRQSPRYDSRTVAGPVRGAPEREPPPRPKPKGQLKLF